MAKKKQMLLIINPRSGREKIRLKLLDILDAYTGAGYQIQVHVTQKSLDARDAVLKYGGKKDLIVCSGGDVTLNEVISGMMELTKPVALGYIPAGSTNDFASSLKLPKQITNVIKCKNPRCITSIEQGLDQVFILADPEKEVYRCKYCEEKYRGKRNK